VQASGTNCSKVGDDPVAFLAGYGGDASAKRHAVELRRAAERERPRTAVFVVINAAIHLNPETLSGEAATLVRMLVPGPVGNEAIAVRGARPKMSSNNQANAMPSMRGYIFRLLSLFAELRPEPQSPPGDGLAVAPDEIR